MVIRILFSALLITSCSLQAMGWFFSLFKKDTSMVPHLSELIKERYLTRTVEDETGTRTEIITDVPNHPDLLMTSQEFSVLKKRANNIVEKVMCSSITEECISEILPINSITFNHDDTLFVIGYGNLAKGGSGQVTVLDVKTGDRSQFISKSGVDSIAFNRTGTLFAMGCADSTVGICDLQTGKKKHIVRHDAAVTSVAFNGDGTKLISGSYRGMAFVSDVETRESITYSTPDRCLGSPFKGRIVLFSSGMFPLAFNYNDTRYAVRDKKQVCIYNRDDGVDTLQCTINHPDIVLSVVSTPDDMLLITNCHDNVIRIIDAQTGAIEHEITHPIRVTSVKSSPDGMYCATGDRNGDVRIIAIQTGEIKHVIHHSLPVNCLAFNHDGTWLATGCAYDEIRFITVKTGKEMCTDGTPSAKGVFGKALYSFDQQLTLNECVLLEACALAARDTKTLPLNQRARIHANPQQWATWKSLRAKLNGGKDKPDNSSVQYFARYIVEDSEELNQENHLRDSCLIQ